MFRKHHRQQMASSHVARYSRRLLSKERGVPACLSYIVEGDRIRLPGKPGGVQFDFAIGDVVETEETIVICLDVPEGSRCSENVYAIDRDGNLRWRIRPQAIDSKSGPFVAVTLHNGFLRLHSSQGRSYPVDCRTGSMIGEAGLR